MRTILRTTGALVLAGLVAAGCGSDDSSADSDDTKRPANPPTSLAKDSFGDTVTVTDSGATHDGDVTIDRATGDIHVVWADDVEDADPIADYFQPQDLFIATSTDGGKSFSEPTRVNDEPGTVTAGFNWQAKVVTTGEDRVLVTWPYANEDGAYKVRSQLSVDGGRTFSEFVDVGAKGGDETSDGYQGVATWGRNVYVGFLDYSNDVVGIKTTTSTDGGRSYGEPVVSEATSCQCCDNGLVADSKGTIYFAYRNLDQRTSKTQVRDSAVIRSYDQGRTWSDPVKLGNDDWEFNGCPEGGPELAVDADDHVHGIYWTGLPDRPGVYYVRSDDRGESFDTTEVLATDEFYPPAYMDIAAEDDGTAWAVWDDRREKTRKVHLARISDGEVETLDGALGDGVTPTIDSDGSMVVMSWSDDDGFHVRTRGEAAKNGFGSGRGDEDSKAEEEHGGGH